MPTEDIVSVEGKLYIGCDHKLLYAGAKDLDGNFLNGGTATYVLVDEYAEPDTDPLSEGDVDYVASSNGDYMVIVDASDLGPDVVKEGNTYLLTVTVSCSDHDDTRIWRLAGARRT